MHSRRLWAIVVVGLALLSGPVAAPAAAQDQGLAVITSPLEGAVLSGAVPILGSASHGQFQRYELSFAYSPNPTDTWFPLPAPGDSPVVNDVLGQWDTSQVSDGLYILRLRVIAADGSLLEAFVQNVRLQNATPTPASQPTEAPTPNPGEVPTLTPAPSPTPAIVLPPTATSRPTSAVDTGATGGPGPSGGSPARINAQLVGAAFLAGVRLTVISFLLLGAYLSLKAILRARPRQ
jgi:hypothetical protein